MSEKEKRIEQLPEPEQDLSILHVFADRGIESEVLSDYGEVVRIGNNIKENGCSNAINADVTEFPIHPDTNFDLGLFHPPCGRWAQTTSISGKSSEWPNHIPLCRNLADTYCDEYIIENVINAPLEDPTILCGRMFGLPIGYKRGFETSFPVDSTSKVDKEMDVECSTYFYSDRSHAWWSSVKGYPQSYAKRELSKNCVPAPYLRHLMQYFLKHTNCRDADWARSNHVDKKPKRLRSD